MKTNVIKSLTVLLGAGILLVSACKKEEAVAPVNPSTPSSTPSALGNFFSANIVAATQTFTIDASINQNITGAKGTKIYFSPNTFKKASGALANGNISIELIEVLSKSDMILLNKTTRSGGKLLISGGEISVKAFQNGEQLTLTNSSSNIYVQMPSENPGSYNMILFAGQPQQNGDVNWALTGLNGPNANVIPDTVGVNGGGGYSFVLGSDSIPSNDSLGWTNVDQFASYSNGTSVEITTPSIHFGANYSAQTLANTQVYVYFNSLNAVSNLYWNTTTSKWDLHTYGLAAGTGFPIGSQVKIVAISEINGQYYSSITPATLSANFNMNISLNPTTLSALKNDINNL